MRSPENQVDMSVHEAIHEGKQNEKYVYPKTATKNSKNYKQIAHTAFDYTTAPYISPPVVPKSSPPIANIIKPKIINSPFNNGNTKRITSSIVNERITNERLSTTAKTTYFGVDDSYYKSNRSDYTRSPDSIIDYNRSKSLPPFDRSDDSFYSIPKSKDSLQSGSSTKVTSPVLTTSEQIEMAKRIQSEMQTWKFKNGKQIPWKESNVDEDDYHSEKSYKYGLANREASYMDSAYESTKGYYTPTSTSQPRMVTTFEAVPAYAVLEDDNLVRNAYSEERSKKTTTPVTKKVRTHETIISQVIETEQRRVVKSGTKSVSSTVKTPDQVSSHTKTTSYKSHDVDTSKPKEKVESIVVEKRKVNKSPQYESSNIKSSVDTLSTVKTVKSSPKQAKTFTPVALTFSSQSEIIISKQPSSGTTSIQEDTKAPTKTESMSATSQINTETSVYTPPRKFELIKFDDGNDKGNKSSYVSTYESQESSVTNYVTNKQNDKKQESMEHLSKVEKIVPYNDSSDKNKFATNQITRNVVIEEFINSQTTILSKVKRIPQQKEKTTETSSISTQTFAEPTKLGKTEDLILIPLKNKPIVPSIKMETAEISVCHNISKEQKIPRYQPSPIIPIPNVYSEEKIIKFVDAPSKPSRTQDTLSNVSKITTTTTTEQINHVISHTKIQPIQPAAASPIITTPQLAKPQTKDVTTNTETVETTRSNSPDWQTEFEETILTEKFDKEVPATEISDEIVKTVIDKVVDNMMQEKSSKKVTTTKQSSQVSYGYTAMNSSYQNTKKIEMPVTQKQIVLDDKYNYSKDTNISNNTYSNSTNMKTSDYVSTIKPRTSAIGLSQGSGGYDNYGVVSRVVTSHSSSTSAGMSPFAQNAAINIRDTREREKKEMSDLNDRLATYIEKVRFLEAQNRKLAADLDLLRSKFGKGTVTVRGMYEKELEQARRIIEESKDDRVSLDKSINGLLEEIETYKMKYEETKMLRNSDRKIIEDLIHTLTKIQSETQNVHKLIDNLNDDVLKMKRENGDLLQELQRTRNDVDQETLNRIDYQNQVTTLLEEISFIVRANKQEILDLQAMAYRDTTTENREYFKSELSAAMRDIREEYDQVCNAQRTDIESWYRIKIQEIQTKFNHKNMEQSYAKEEVRKLRSQLGEIRGRLADLESRNAILEKQQEELSYQISDDQRTYEASITDRDEQIRKMRSEHEALMVELQALLDKKQTLDAEIAMYRKMLDGEENRAGLRLLAEQVAKTRGFSQSSETETVRLIKGEHTSRSGFSRSAKGNVSIVEANMDGKCIVLENSNRSKEENIGGWKIKRIVGGSEPRDIVVTFPKDLILKPMSSVKIFARNAGVHRPPESLVTDEESFGSGNHVQTFLFNKAGEERATLLQRANLTVS
uniref:ASD2 domain-containing protein n=1 Tax=Rhabditophanes sp. KR3021 TaxID=114890 RepID=A0AC35U8H9_9BILA